MQFGRLLQQFLNNNELPSCEQFFCYKVFQPCFNVHAFDFACAVADFLFVPIQNDFNSNQIGGGEGGEGGEGG